MNGKELETAQAVNASVVRTRRLEILDSKSHTRAFVDTLDGEAVFCLTNEQGLRSVEVRSGKESGAAISLVENGNTSRIGIALTKNGNSLITLLDAEGVERYRVEVDALGVIQLSTKKGARP